jgi:hypothetical protein
MKDTLTSKQLAAIWVAVLPLLISGITWLAMPRVAMGIFTVPLDGTAYPTYGYVKGMEDILPALMVLLLISTGSKSALRIGLLVSALVAVSDAAIVSLAHGLSLSLLVHVPYALLPLGAAYLLRDQSGGSKQRAS